jgi:hypothetical protein
VTSPAPRILSVLTVRNEGAFLIEWLAHARACGFTDILVFSNDCDDGTDTMLDRLAALGWLTHVPNPGPHPKGPQWHALKQADAHPLVLAADWVLVCDIDEFVNVQVGDGTIPALLTALPDATAIPLTWRMFGNAGVVEYTDAPVTEIFTHAAPRDLAWPWRAQMFKTLFRRDGTYAKLGVHRPRAPDTTRIDAARWFDGSGRRLPPAFHTGRVFTNIGSDPYALVQLNHYPLGAMQSYLVKCDRGRANRDASAFDLGYWVERNFSDVQDLSIQRLALARKRNHLELMGDAVLSALHQTAVNWRHQRFISLMQDDAWRNLFGCLRMIHPSRALTPQEALTVWRYGTHTDTT